MGLRKPTHERKLIQSVTNFAYIEGLRGACSLYVCVHHAFYQFWYDTPNGTFFPGIFGKILEIFNYGHFAVGYFIVISGFCIFQAGDRSGVPVIRKGLKSYAFRRVRRIVPPYYLAILLYCGVVAAIPSLQQPSGRLWDDSLPIFHWKSLASHFLFLHCNFPDWENTISGTFWSIGIEWWVYWLIPLSILPIWRMLGPLAGVTSSFLLAYVLIGLGIFNLNGCPWFLGLFALGMAVAQISRPQSPYRSIRESTFPWILLSFILLGVAIYCFESQAPEWFFDPIVGLSCASLLLGCRNSGSRLKAILESGPLKTVGKFSYSLYLCHWIVLTVFYDLGLKMNLSLHGQLWMTFGLAVPSAIGFSYLFYLFAEKPFQTGTNRSG